jgi:hypothetical protein
VRDDGFRVHLPSLFGTDGAYPDAERGRAVLERACVSAEFRAFGGGAASPVTSWLRALARWSHDTCGGPGVGAPGDRFVATTLPDDAANPDPPPFFREVVGVPHSVVTAHLVDAAGEPTIGARDEILAFFRRRLRHPR